MFSFFLSEVVIQNGHNVHNVKAFYLKQFIEKNWKWNQTGLIEKLREKIYDYLFSVVVDIKRRMQSTGGCDSNK